MQTNIIAWNPINDLYSNIKASAYIKPTLDILKLFQRAPANNVLVRIHGTDSCYDDGEVFATIDKSSDVPTFRDNFFNCYGLYVITFSHNWKGYPLQNGSVEFLEGVVQKQINYIEGKEEKEDKKEEKKEDRKEDKKEDKKEIKESVLNNVRSGDTQKGVNTNVLIIIGVSIALILASICFMKM